jgi:hypothetical protein
VLARPDVASQHDVRFIDRHARSDDFERVTCRAEPLPGDS